MRSRDAHTGAQVRSETGTPPKTYPAGRVCASPGCTTILSIYRPGPLCSTCERKPLVPIDLAEAPILAGVLAQRPKAKTATKTKPRRRPVASKADAKAFEERRELLRRHLELARQTGPDEWVVNIPEFSMTRTMFGNAMRSIRRDYAALGYEVLTRHGGRALNGDYSPGGYRLRKIGEEEAEQDTRADRLAHCAKVAADLRNLTADEQGAESEPVIAVETVESEIAASAHLLVAPESAQEGRDEPEPSAVQDDWGYGTDTVPAPLQQEEASPDLSLPWWGWPGYNLTRWRTADSGETPTVDLGVAITRDSELAAMSAIVEALGTLDGKTRARVLAWVGERFECV